MAGKRISDLNSFEVVELDQIFDLKKELELSTGTDFWSKAGRWFFADRSKRTISPQSPVTVPCPAKQELGNEKQGAAP